MLTLYLVEKGVLFESPIAACFSQRHVSRDAGKLGLFVGRRRLRDGACWSLDGVVSADARRPTSSGAPGVRRHLLPVLADAVQLLLLLLLLCLIGQYLKSKQNIHIQSFNN